eukprot:437984_1
MSAQLFVVLLLSLSHLSCNGNSQLKRPHIFFLMADQHRADVLGSSSINKGGITPNLDAIQSDGILFSNAYTSTPSCTPARAGLLTGRSPWGHGLLGNGKISMNYSFELINALNNNGYYTSSIGKNHYGYLNQTMPVLHNFSYHAIYDGLGTGLPNDTTHPFDDYDIWFQTENPGTNPEATGGNLMDWNSWRGAPFIYNNVYHPIQWVTDSALQFLDSYFNTTHSDNLNPLFMKISYHRPHSPYDPPQQWIDYIMKNGNLDKITHINRCNGDDCWDMQYEKGYNGSCGEQNVDAWCGLMPVNETNISRINYYANVAFIDDGIGQIINKLKYYNVYDNSFVIYSADHGDQLGDHNLWRKTFPYQSDLNIPMILKWPESNVSTFNSKDVQIKRGTVINEAVVELRDLLPTFLNVSESKIPSNISSIYLFGKNMNCLLYYKDINNALNECKWRQWIDIEHSLHFNVTNHWNGLTDGKIKYIFNAYYANEQLFNLTTDPLENIDLAPRANNDSFINDTLNIWRQRLINQWIIENRGPKWVINNTMQQRVKGQTYGPNYPGYQPPIGDIEFNDS